MTVLIVLGNRLNDDGSFTKAMQERMNITLDIVKKYNVDYIILSGGVANKNIKISEAEAMKNYLVSKGLDENKIIPESKSMSTYENAKFSIPMALELNPDTIIVCSSLEHFTTQPYNLCTFFSEFINDKHIDLVFYTKSGFNAYA